MRIVITGATGLVGRELVGRLIDEGDSVAVLTRDLANARKVLPPQAEIFEWDPLAGSPPTMPLEGSDAVVHLMGEPIQGRWTRKKKERIYQSRVNATSNLVAALTAMERPPGTVVSASAVGLYGDRGDETLYVESGPGDGFLADVAKEWERSLVPLVQAGVDVTPVRFGVVLSTKGGALKELLRPWRFGLGSKFGDGSQWWPWIHIDDAVGLIFHLSRGHGPGGPINAVAPETVTQAQLADQLARALGRPRLFRLPAWSLRMLLGEMSWELTSSRRVAASRTGYEFRFPTLASALENLVGVWETERTAGQRYETETRVDAPIDEVFSFFSDPGNLERITPPWLKFRILSSLPPDLGVGALIDYRLRLRGFPIVWQSEITEWDPPFRFVDVQRKGPYRSWVHTHRFQPLDGGTVVRDTVDYAVPGGYLIDKLLVRGDLARIFAYRQRKLKELIPSSTSTAD